MKNIKHYILLLLLMTVVGQSTIYETAEDKKTSRWQVLYSSSEGKVKNVYDKKKSSRVITFKGEGTKSAYRLLTNEGASLNNEEEYILHWQMKYSEDFVIIVGMDTDKGKRYMLYTPGTKDGYMQYGLGDSSRDGVWHRYTRNLLDDLTHFDNQNSINYIESFVIRGDGSIDNIKMMKKHFKENSKPHKDEKSNKKVKEKKKPQKKKALEEEPIEKPIEKKPIKKKIIKKKVIKKKIKPIRKSIINSTPIIHIEGDNPLYLKRGEKFVEPGVRADDKEDGDLIVNSSENIDSLIEGKYSVIYIATDSQGDSAVDTRYVIVGDGENSQTNASQPDNRPLKVNSGENASSENRDDESSEDEDFQLEERELEISEWEKELEEREKEIAKREMQMQTSMETQDAF